MIIYNKLIRDRIPEAIYAIAEHMGVSAEEFERIRLSIISSNRRYFSHIIG